MDVWLCDCDAILRTARCWTLLRCGRCRLLWHSYQHGVWWRKAVQ